MLLSVECVLAFSRSQFPANVPRKQPFARHLSFDQICEVATIEHEKLSSVQGSQHNYLLFILRYICKQLNIIHYAVFDWNEW